MSVQVYTLSPIPSTVWINLEIPNATTTVDLRASDGRILTAPERWILLPPGDATLTRRVKEAGDHWLVHEKKGR